MGAIFLYLEKIFDTLRAQNCMMGGGFMRIEMTEQQMRTRGGVMDELLEKTFDAAVIVDRDGRFVYNTKGSLALRKIDPEEVAGKYYWEVNPDAKFHTTLESGRAQLGVVDVVEGRKCLVNIFPICCGSKVIGALSTVLFKNLTNLKQIIAKLPDVYGTEVDSYNTVSRLTTSYTFSDYIGESPAARDVVQQCRLAAQSMRPVLLIGETGTGKEILANSIHAEVNRHVWTPCIKINCSAIPDNLLESELFGHEKGAFTGAQTTKIGKFELASNGSILLDEIGEMDMRLQSKLLRVLEEKEFERIGGSRLLPLKARLISSTNANLRQLCKEGKFRSDLYYRLAAFEIHVPPLRARATDIPLLVESLKQRDQLEFSLKEGAMDVLMEYRWPGNVRELRNILSRLDIKYRRQWVSGNAVQQELEQSIDYEAPAAQMQRAAITDEQAAVYAHMEALLEQNGHNVAKTARELGVSRATVYNRLKKRQKCKM